MRAIINGKHSTLDPYCTHGDLLETLASGGSVQLEIDMIPYLQIDGSPNKNFLRFKRGNLRSVAKSFKGMPFLRDHEHGDLRARGGTITKSKAVKRDDGTMVFEMSASITAPWAVEAILRGNLDRFSIGWDHGGRETIHCTVCSAPIFTECSHFPGDSVVVDEDSGETETVEFEFTEAEGIEVSGVSVPAVAGTGISEIRSALSRSAAVFAAKRATLEAQDMEKIAIALGLTADASEETILAAIEARGEVVKQLSKSVDELETQNARLTDELTQARATEREIAVNALFVEHADRFPKMRTETGELRTHPAEARLRKLAETDLEAARGILAVLPKHSPVMGDPESLQPAAPSQGPSTPTIDPIVAKQCAAMGMSAEDTAKYTAQAKAELAARHGRN
jgi:phage head maturation protease